MPNERIHIVGINDGQTISFYVNGVAATGALAPYARNVNGFRLGGGAGGTIPYQGQVSDMTIYNRAISPAEAADLYNHTIVTNGLVSRHKLDEGAGKTAFDSYGSAELTRSNNLYVTDGEIHSLQNDLGYSNALSFDGANDYLQTAADADFAFGTEPFTIDTRVYIA